MSGNQTSRAEPLVVLPQMAKSLKGFALRRLQRRFEINVSDFDKLCK